MASLAALRLVATALATVGLFAVAPQVAAATAADDTEAHGAHHGAAAPAASAPAPVPTAPAPAPAPAPAATMDHGNMKMQGGSAPQDARDPNAYSGGYTLESGPYAIPGPRLLRLSDEHYFGSVLVDRMEWAHSSDGGALYEVYNPMPYEAAREMEVELAIGLREAGYGVWQA